MDRRWLLCGLVAALMAPAVVLWGGVQWTAHAPRAFNHVTQTISELVARDAPGRAAVSALFVIYNGLLAAFGLALRDLAGGREPAGGPFTGPVTGHGAQAGDRIVALAALGVLLLAAPMDPVGAPRSPIGLVHTSIAGMMAVVATGAALSGGRWLGHEPGMAAYARLSQATVALMILFGALTLAGSWLGLLGLMERLLTGAFEVWLGVVAVGLYRAVGETRAGRGAREQAAHARSQVADGG